MISTTVSENNTDLLLEAFHSFSAASDSLKSAYSELQGKVDLLSRELDQSNYYLTTVLESLPCGVLVVDQDKMVTTINPAAEEPTVPETYIWSPGLAPLRVSR